ncbi:MAG: hypothetical protein HY700_19830 [Gemmatimonadetes bacterium]|nr:hypothetical protein [Gemmatimonadota bacterium]
MRTTKSSQSYFRRLTLAAMGVAMLGACKDPNASGPVKPANRQLVSVAPNEPADFVTLTDWPMDSLTGGGWAWCSYYSATHCQVTTPPPAIVARDSSAPGSAPNVMQWIGAPGSPPLLTFSGAHRREEYSAFWWKGSGASSLVRRYIGEYGTMTLSVTQSGTLVLGLYHAPQLLDPTSHTCYKDWENWWYCTISQNVNPTIGAVTPGVWHRVEMYLKAADLRDGIIRIWVDDALVVDYSAIPLSVGYVTSQYSLGAGGLFDDVRISMPKVPRPAMVTSIRPMSATSTSVTLNFAHAEDGTGHDASYVMRFAPTPIAGRWGSATPVTEGTCAELRSTGAASSSCSVEGLSPGTSYDFQMVAYRNDSSGAVIYGPLSPVVTVSTTTAPAGAPPAILNLGVYWYRAPRSLTLYFTEVDDGTRQPATYEMRYARSPIGSDWGSATSVTQGTCKSPMPGKSAGAFRSCTVEGLEPGVTYDFQMVAFRGTPDVDAVFGGLSNVATATTTIPLPPRPPEPPPIPNSLRWRSRWGGPVLH